MIPILLIVAALILAMFLAVAKTSDGGVGRLPREVAGLFAPTARRIVGSACLRGSDQPEPRMFPRERRADSGRPAKVRKATKATNLLTFADPLTV